MNSHKTLVIAGASGVIGRHIRTLAHSLGWSVRALTVSEHDQQQDPTTQWVTWNPQSATKNDAQAIAVVADTLRGADALINLAGSSMDGGRMGPKHRHQILQSRMSACRALAAGLEASQAPPAVWVQASGVGYYGDTGEDDVTEQTPRCEDLFVGEICRQWESEGTDANVPIRRIVARIGLVLAPDAPAFIKMMRPVRLGVGGKLGHGQQWYSWISGTDVARAFLHLINTDATEGPYNLTSPTPIRQIDMTTTLAKAIGRPAIFPTPAFVLRTVLGGVADELLLPSCRALPTRLQESGFQFKHERFDDVVETLVA